MLKFKKGANEERVQREEEAKKVYDEAQGVAQNLLNSEGFERYKRIYENLEKNTILQLMDMEDYETDPVKYGFQCKSLVSRLRHVRLLIDQISQDAGKRK